jgi:BRCA1-associated protein
MPAYFFHLAFELYPSRGASSQTSPSTSTTFTPPPNTDLFSELPAHTSTSWSLNPHQHQRDCSRTLRRPECDAKHKVATPTTHYLAPTTHHLASLGASSSDVSRHRPQHSSRRFSHQHQQRTRASLSEPSPHDSPVPIVKSRTRPRTQSVAHKDWRFDTISIVSIDMKTVTSSGGLATKGKFIPSDLKDTEVGWGVVHLYRDGQETPGLYDEDAGTEFDEEDCTTLCILAVPSYMTPSDLLGFVGEQTREGVSHFRLIKTARANKYMVLMKFREAETARAWRKLWNGKTFNSMEVR